MKYCQHCGKEVLDDAVICMSCGCSVTNKPDTEVDESVSAGLVILAVLIPLFGIIYWPVKAKTRPKCAVACGVAAIISWAVSFICLMSMGM